MDDRLDALRAVVRALGATSSATSACGGVSTSRKDGACGGVSTSRKDGACGARAGLSKTGVAVVAFPPSPLHENEMTKTPSTTTAPAATTYLRCRCRWATVRRALFGKCVPSAATL